MGAKPTPPCCREPPSSSGRRRLEDGIPGEEDREGWSPKALRGCSRASPLLTQRLLTVMMELLMMSNFFIFFLINLKLSKVWVFFFVDCWCSSIPRVTPSCSKAPSHSRPSFPCPLQKGVGTGILLGF